MPRIFVSCSQKDRELVNRLADDLEARVQGAQVLYDMRIEPGGSWAVVLEEGIRSADVIIAALSPVPAGLGSCAPPLNPGARFDT